MKTLTSKQISELIGTTNRNFALSRSKVDPTFPQPIKRMNGVKIMWDESLIMDWLATYKRYEKTIENPKNEYKSTFDNQAAQQFIRCLWWDREKDTSRAIKNITKNHCSHSEWY